MPKIAVYKSLLEGARDRAPLSESELELAQSLIAQLPSGMPRVELADFPKPLVRAMLDDSKLRPAQRASIALFLYGISEGDVDHTSVYNMTVHGPVDFGSALSLDNRRAPNAEVHWNGRWYPVIVQPTFTDDENKVGKVVHCQVQLAFGDFQTILRWNVAPSLFLDEQGNAVEWTVMQVIEKFGMRRVQTRAADFNRRLVRAEQLATDFGTQVWVKGAVMELHPRFWYSDGLNERQLGTADVPRRAIVEPVLQSDREGIRGYGNSTPGNFASRLPLVRLFSLDLKSFVYADVDDLEVYEYDAAALGRLCLPEKMKGVLKSLFETPTDQLFGDLVRGKHGGIVILACGTSGVGKTLTAEVYAEIARRPLYSLEFGELGTSVQAIENNLQAIFARVVRWRAVLQFDECEIFLSQRGDDLERSAIVGIFLRMLDYYEGLLFLTTNRADSLDHAIRSRVMIRLDYPNLDAPARAVVWRTMFESAQMVLEEGTFESLAESNVNGRQIRNLVRLARILHPERKITLTQMRAILEYACR